jgi:PAS domain S-box-containing protein
MGGAVDNLEAAAAQAKLGAWEYDADRRRFRFSDIVGELLGLSGRAEVDLDTVSKLHVGESAGMLVRAIELALEDGRPFSLVSEVETPAGNRRWIRTQGQVSPATGSASPRLFGTVQDISEIRQLDRVTRESEMTLNQVEQISHIGHFSVDLSDGSFFHSDEIKRIFGYEPSEYALSVEEAIEAYHPDDRAEVVRLFNRAVETGEGYEFDLRVVQPSGDIRHVHSKGYTEQDEGGNVTRVYGVFQDVTEQVLAQQALRQSEASMKALLDGIHTAIVVHGKDGEILLANPMAQRLLAPLTSDMVGKQVTDPAWRFVFEDGREVPVEELPVSTVLRTREPLENLVLGCRGSHGLGWLLVNGVPVLDDHGELSKVVISFVDITERKTMEQRLHQSEKMQAIGHLAGGVAHDFNNQLMVMLSFAKLLEDSFGEDAIERKYTEGLLKGVNRSAELTSQLLAFARKGKYMVTTVDLSALMNEVASMAKHSFDKKIRIMEHSSADQATVAGDASQLQNALLNIALNSRDAMPEGGELTFTTERVTLDEASWAEADVDGPVGECVRITIGDTGVGMDAETQKHMFEPFFTTKGRGMGTGMGMASVYGTVENHHGAIQVDSEPGAGTRVTLHFPFVAQDRPVREEIVSRSEVSGGRILIIDDDEAVALSLSMMLDRKGYETTTCANGRDALIEFSKASKRTDLVLLDMIMPEMNGVETFHALRDVDPDVKVVLISGYSFTDEAKGLMEEGAQAFLLKPVTRENLLRTISDVLGVNERAS